MKMVSLYSEFAMTILSPLYSTVKTKFGFQDNIQDIEREEPLSIR